MDIVPDNVLLIKMQYVFAAFYILYSRGYTSGTGGIIGVAEKILLKVPESMHSCLRDFFGKFVQIWNNNKKSRYFCYSTINEAKIYFPADMFSTFRRISMS